MSGKSTAAKAAAKSTAAAAKALAAAQKQKQKDATVWHDNDIAETSDEEEPVKAAAKGKKVAKPKVPKEEKEKEVKEKRTRAPSAFNLYMKVRLAEMKLDEVIMAETPTHKARFSQAAAEWSAMTDEEKAIRKLELLSIGGQTTPPPPKKTPLKAPDAPIKAAKKLQMEPEEEEEEEESGDDSNDEA